MWSVESKKRTVFALEHLNFCPHNGFVRFKKENGQLGRVLVINVVRKKWLMEMENSSDAMEYGSLVDLIDDGWIMD